MSNYKEYKKLNLSEIHKTILREWNKNNTFDKCIKAGKGKSNFTFYEGPPSANGILGNSSCNCIVLSKIYFVGTRLYKVFR